LWSVIVSFLLALSEVRLDCCGGSVAKEENYHSTKKWLIRDDNIWSTDYEIPEFKTVDIEVSIQKEITDT
jgi:hypothetical protein